MTELSDGQLALHRAGIDRRRRRHLDGVSVRNWVLPEYIEDILPPEAEAIEQLRRDAARSLPRITTIAWCSRRWSSTSIRC